jgi:hypothetical protein
VVGHAGDVIADDSCDGNALGLARVGRGHFLRMLEKKLEQLVDQLDRAVAIFGDGFVRINARDQKALKSRILFGGSGGESGDAGRVVAPGL